MGNNRDVPFGMAVAIIILVASIVGVGVYYQSVSFSNVDPVMMRVVKPQQVSSEKTMATKTYRNDVYGLEFTYSPEWGDIQTDADDPGQISLMKNGNRIFYLLTKENLTLTQKNQKRGQYEVDFYDIPKGTAVDEWIINKQGRTYVDLGDGYFSNKIGQAFDVAGLKALHLVNRQGPMAGSSNAWDEFYFVKDGQLYVLTIMSDPDPSTRDELNLNDDSQWYTQLLKSFRLVDVH